MADKRGDKGVPPRIVAHFHEWMTGIAIIMLRLWKVDLATVLTTHSTIIGRSLCVCVIGFYDNLEKAIFQFDWVTFVKSFGSWSV